MACERNRIVELKEYLQSLGINLNIGKNNARGHKGVFMHNFGTSRIDISKKIKDDNLLSVMLHEFAHYIHYSYDKSLTSLDFIFNNLDDEILEELIRVTVHEVPKDFACALHDKKLCCTRELSTLVDSIKQIQPDFKLSSGNDNIEKNISFPIKYLLKYDRIKFLNKLYSIEELEKYNLNNLALLYIKIKSKQRAIKRINAKIRKLNKYYNNYSELFARFIDSYYTNHKYTLAAAPKASSIIKKSKNPYILDLNNIFM